MIESLKYSNRHISEMAKLQRSGARNLSGRGYNHMFCLYVEITVTGCQRWNDLLKHTTVTLNLRDGIFTLLKYIYHYICTNKFIYINIKKQKLHELHKNV